MGAAPGDEFRNLEAPLGRFGFAPVMIRMAFETAALRRLHAACLSGMTASAAIDAWHQYIRGLYTGPGAAMAR